MLLLLLVLVIVIESMRVEREQEHDYERLMQAWVKFDRGLPAFPWDGLRRGEHGLHG